MTKIGEKEAQRRAQREAQVSRPAPPMRPGLPPAEADEIARALAYYRKHRIRQRKARATRKAKAIAVAFGLMMLAAPAHALVCFDGPKGECVLSNDQGGMSDEYEPFIAKLRSSGRAVVIRGDCTSYCTILADRLRSQTCLDTNAGFHFHKMVHGHNRLWARDVIADAWDPDFSAPLASWIASKGGLPEARAAYDTLYMSHTEALKLWRACS